MIQELRKEEFYKLNDIKRHVRHVEIRAIIEGTNPGRIFVDDLSNPISALVWYGNLDGFGFIGDANNPAFNTKINCFIDGFIIKEAKRLGLQWFECFGNSMEWEERIKDLFKYRNLALSTQQVYQLDSSLKNNNDGSTLPAPYDIIKFTPESYHKWAEQPFVKHKISEFWNSENEFFNVGRGYGVVHHDKVVSLCFSAFVSGNVHGIDIETSKEHRGKGLGTLSARALINEYIDNGIKPYWDCMKSNEGSIAVAKAAGLELSFEYSIIEFRI